MMTIRRKQEAMMIPKRLKEARLEAGLSQEKLAELADVDATNSRSQISSYEAGRHTPPFNFVIRIAKALDYPEAYFYTLDDIFAKTILQLYRNRNNSDFNPYLIELNEVKQQLSEAHRMASNLANHLAQFKK